jgi:group I intron endonuclease
MSAIIYRLTNTINQKTYIGLTTKTLDERWRGHVSNANCGSSYHLHKAIRKYGEDAFTREVLEETTTDLMNGRERYWIAECSPEYNMTSGGEGVLGLSHTPETRAKLSVAARNMSPEHRAKISAAQTGEKHHMYGKPMSPETREKISVAQRGKTLSPEHRAKLSAAARKRYSK